MSDVLLIDNSILQETVLVPVTTVQPDLVTQTDVVVYVPLASKNAHGIVKIGDGLNITNDGELWWDASEVPIKYIAKNGEDIVPDDNKRVNIVLNKIDVGLSNVDNTSDLDKPISNATQQAINIVKNDVDNLSNSIDDLSDSIDALLQTGVYSINGKTGNVVLKNSDLENDTNYATEQYVQENGGKIDKIVLNDNEQEIINKIVTLTIDKTTVGLSNVDNTSDLNKPISTQTQTALDGLNQTITNNFNNLNSSIENETERATLAETEISTKLQQEMNTRVQEHSEIQGKIDTINSKIPNQASSTNQLADKDFVNSTINSSAAFFKGSFKSKAALDAIQWQTTDSSLTTYVTNNDYAYVEADETHNNEAWRYIYVKDNTVSEWQPQFRVNESPFTQAQLDAINSGATTDLINSINSKLTADAIVDETGDSSIKAISQRAATLGINTVQSNLNTHILDKNNPHQVTKTQVGLSNVDNTSDIDKPISTAVQSALDLMLPRSEAPTKVSDLENDAAYIKNNDRLSSVQIPYIYNVQQIYSVEDKDQLFGNPDGKTQIDLSSDSVSIDRQYPNTPTYIPVFASRRDDVRDVTSIQSASTKRIIVNGVEEPSFPNNMGVLRVVSEDDGSYIEANLSKLTVVQDEAGSNTLHQDSKSLIFNWNGLYLNNNEISPNTIRYDIEQTLTDAQKAQARANIGAGTGGGTVVSGYGTCSTDGGTSAKVVTIADTNWKLKVGTIIGVKFTNTNSASNVTLNVNNTGAKSIYYSNIVYTGNNENIVGYSGKIIYYMYDGTYWCWLNSSVEKDTLTSAYCDTTSATAAKTASYTNYQLLAKSYLHITMTNANTSKTALTLNVNGKGAKPIYINGIASSMTNYTLPAGTYIIYYDGANYHFRTDGVLPNIDTYPAITFAESERQKSASSGAIVHEKQLTEQLSSYLPLTGGHLTGLVTTTDSFNILNSTGSARLGSIGAYNNTYVSIDANNGIVLSTKAYSKKWFLIIGDDGSLTFQQ